MRLRALADAFQGAPINQPEEKVALAMRTDEMVPRLGTWSESPRGQCGVASKFP
jgi:hypothetical protein